MVPVRDPATQSFIAHSVTLALKMLLVGSYTAKVRHAKKAFANEEDAVSVGGKLTFDDPDVERVRRAHLNDLENIPVFWLVGSLYLTTGPSAAVATWLFRAYTIGRFMHTLVYAFKPMPQPLRFIAYEIAHIPCGYMAIRVLLHYFRAL